jgi:hypothetical protein
MNTHQHIKPQSIFIRAARHNDTSALLAMDKRLSAETRFLHYLGGSHLTPEKASQLCESDPQVQAAFVAMSRATVHIEE